MKKIIFLAAACLMAAVACERENPQEQTSLQTPELEAADVTETSFTVRWSPVEGADSYDWELNAGAEQGSTTQTELQFSAMETGTYKVRVKAVSSERGIESAWAEINVMLEAGLTDIEFNLTATQVDGMKLNVKTSPEDKEAPYYFEPVTQSIFEQAEDAETLFRDILNARITTSSSLADAFEKYARTGDANVNYDISAYPEPVYYVLIAGIDEQMNTTTPVHYVEVPIEVTTSDNEFTVSVTDLQLTSITVQVAPLNDDPYAIILQDTETVDALSDAQLRELLAMLVNDNAICSGTESMTYSKNIVPSHSYTLLVFGWEDNLITTEINKTLIVTPDPVTEEDLSFEFNVDVTGPTTATVEVTPSSQEASYFYDVVTMSDWNLYQQDPARYIEEMAAGMRRTVPEYLRMFGSVGTQTADYDDFVLMPNTEHVLFALGYTLNGNSVTFQKTYSTTFTTPEEEEVVTPPVEDLTFDLTIFSDVNAEFYMSIVPSDESATYVYAVMTDTDYDDYFPDGISDYFRGRYESSGFDGTFAEYVKSIMNTGPYEGLSSGFYVADDCWYYILIAAGVSINGEEVSFYAPAESSWYETW